MKDLIKKIAEGKGSSKSFVDYITDAHVEFLTDVSSKIKKFAKGKVDKISVKKFISEGAMLSYIGEDKNDMGLKFQVSIVTSKFPNFIVIYWVDSVNKGKFRDEKKVRGGLLDADYIVNIFKNYF